MLMDKHPHRGVVSLKYLDRLFGLGRLAKRCESTQITIQDCDERTVASEQFIFAARNYGVGDLRGEKSTEPTEAV